MGGNSAYLQLRCRIEQLLFLALCSGRQLLSQRNRFRRSFESLFLSHFSLFLLAFLFLGVFELHLIGWNGSEMKWAINEQAGGSFTKRNIKQGKFISFTNMLIYILLLRAIVLKCDLKTRWFVSRLENNILKCKSAKSNV